MQKQLRQFVNIRAVAQSNSVPDQVNGRQMEAGAQVNQTDVVKTINVLLYQGAIIAWIQRPMLR